MGTKLHVATGQKISVKVKSAKDKGMEFIKGIVMGLDEDDSIYIEQHMSYTGKSNVEQSSKSIIRLFSLQQIEIVALS